MAEAAELAAALKPDTPAAALRIGTVVAVEAATGRLRLDITGDTWLASDADARFLPGDRVWAVLQGPMGVVGGSLNGLASSVPVGSMTAYAATTPPAGWLLCNGAQVSRTTYAALFAVLGTQYGAGNGTTTFNLPNLTNRVPLGSGTRTPGAVGGAETVTLSVAQMPAHDHGAGGSHDHPSGGSHDHGSAGSHSHSIPQAHAVQSGTGSTSTDDTGSSQSTGSGGSHTHGSAGSHTHGSAGTHTHSSEGSSSPVTVLPPFQVVAWIVKAF